ncbi:hypothetical protein F4604DRAFT_1927411 [Suillus subluteus]|nr:hypothetical protein F4604DRAFT_1927411 [Suillus subluteus]
MALSHLYYGRILQGHGEFFGPGRRDYEIFSEMNLWNIDTANVMSKNMTRIVTANDTVLTATMNLCLPEDGNRQLAWNPLDDCPDYVTEWLSHSLPYHFVTGRVNQSIEAFAIKVISKLLSSPSSPSNQIVANCTLLACVMVELQFDKKDIIQIDKSAALPQLTQYLLMRFQRVLWAWDGGDLEKDSTGVTRQAWNLLDIICRILELAQSHYKPSSDTIRNLDIIPGNCRMVCRMHCASRSPLPKRLGTPADLWDYSYSSLGAGDSHSPEDFDWLMDYYLDIYSDDQEVASDILCLLGVTKVRCSPAKQHQFIESLIACMDSNMPIHLRYVALRATHIVREEIVSIDTIDAKLRDMVLTKFSPAILTTVCPRPGTTLADDPHHFHYRRDLCYLRLIFTLARDSNWHPHLFGDHHIDRCISMVGEYCESYSRCPFYLSGILLRIPSEQLSVASLDAITKQQWWDMMRLAWRYAEFVIDDIHCFEFLPVLVEGTKMYMHIASEDDLRELVGYVDDVLRAQRRRDSEQGEGECVVVAVKEFRTVVSVMLEKLVNSKRFTTSP